MHFLILSGANERAIVAACRDLLESGVGFSIIARPGRDPIVGSFLAPYIQAQRSRDQLDIDDLAATLLTFRHRLPERLIYLPASEALNRLVLENRQRLETECRLEISLPALETYRTLSDKSRFNALAETFGLELPPREPAPRTAPLPLVAKPHAEFSRSGGAKLYPALLFEESQRQQFFAEADEGDYFFQRYIDGQSHYYLFFFGRDGQAVSLFQENIAQQPNGKSIVAAQTCPCPSEDFLEKISACIRSTGFFGFCMVEAITRDGKSYLIELNPRLWGPLSLAIHAGFRMHWLGDPESAAQPAAQSEPARYAWFSGMVRTRLDGGRLRWYPGKRRQFLRQFLAFLRSDIYLQRINTLEMAARELL